MNRYLCLLIFIYFFSFACSTTPNTPPAGVPKTAQWAGGKDGGVWVACRDTQSPNDFLCSIYGENGSLWREAHFQYTPDSTQGGITNQTTIKADNLSKIGYSWYDGHQIKLSDGNILTRGDTQID